MHGLGPARSLALALAAATASAAHAANGLNVIGAGSESILMGGADVGLARDTSALSTNPAGLSAIGSRAVDVFAGVAKALDVSHADRLGNDRAVSNDLLALGGLGIAQPLARCRCTVAAGAFGQGGAGYVYRDLATPFGGRDELSSRLSIVRLAVGAAWAPTDALSLGLSVGVLNGRLEQRLFPGISFFPATAPGAGFAGLALDDASAVRFTARLGLQYRPTPGLTLGLVYAPRTRLPLTGGSLRANYGALGLGTVTYRDARVDGFAQPQELAIGAAWRPTAAWLLSVELQWLDWSGALRATTLSATGPDDPRAPARLAIATPHDWRDQWVLALGAAYAASDTLTWYGGANYGRNPVPSSTVNPLLAAINEWVVSAGLGWRFAPGWTLQAGLAYQVGNRQASTDPRALLPGSVERVRGIVLPITLAARW